ncbi:MAG: class I tRNA ligase family protein, partial [Christensenellales bacterium]
PFKNCIVMGHVQDKDGKKMSKHIGNTVDPWSVLNTQGADAVRWFFYNNAAPWMPNRFHAKAIDETTRKYMGTLWNTYAFFILYAEIDQFNPKEHPLDKAELTLMDRWILSRLNSLVREVDDDLNEYKIFEASRAMTDLWTISPTGMSAQPRALLGQGHGRRQGGRVRDALSRSETMTA